MKRALRTALVALILLTGGARGLPSNQQVVRLRDSSPVASHHANRGPCDQERWLRITPKQSTPKLIKGLISCAVDRWSVSGGLAEAFKVADCESSFYPFAHSNGNYGVYQQRGAYWVGRVGGLLRSEWFSDNQWKRLHTVPGGPYVARANVLLSIRQAHRWGWGSWSCR